MLISLTAIDVNNITHVSTIDRFFWNKDFVANINEAGCLSLTNELDSAVSFKKGQIVGQVRSVLPPNTDVEANQHS